MNSRLLKRVLPGMINPRGIAILFFALAAMSCRAGFNVGTYTSMDTLFAAAMERYKGHHWEDAQKAFERLTNELPPRDPRLPLSYYYLGKSQANQASHLLAATSYTRLSESFPQDTLADDALYESGVEYAQMWRKPSLDATYGQNALNSYQLLVSLYPDSPLVPRAQREIQRLDEWFATKDYDTGYHYLKRKAYDSAIIYFKDVIKLHPNAPHARLAYLRLLDAFRAIKYREDVKDTCDAMNKAYPTDREVIRECGRS